MSVIDGLLTGLIDYAGLYPPAGLDMRSAVQNYLAYGENKHAFALGRFIVDLNRLSELRAVAGDSVRNLRLSVIASPNSEWHALYALIHNGVQIDAIEVKAVYLSDIERIRRSIPSDVTTYFELPVHPPAGDLLEAVSAAGARVKLRMGGVVADAFPSTASVAETMNALRDCRLAFKATAGLHHPVRSRHPFTYAADSPTGTMHGFVNLCCAAALMHFGGETCEAKLLLDEQDLSSWQVTPDTIAWRSYRWSADQLREVREKFLISFGSCSFEEPIHDLETLGWL